MSTNTAWTSSGSEAPFEELWGRAGVFTTIRVEVDTLGVYLVFLDKHIERLYHSLDLLDIRVPFGRIFVREKAVAFLKQNKPQQTSLLRIMVTPERLAVRLAPLQPQAEFLSGSLQTFERAMPAVKSLDYQPVLDFMGTVNRADTEIIFQSHDGRILEGATSNLIFFDGTEFISPARDCLAGITVALLSEKIAMNRQDVFAKSINRYSEIICCGSGRTVVPLSAIQKLNWISSSTQASERLLAAWQALQSEYRQADFIAL